MLSVQQLITIIDSRLHHSQCHILMNLTEQCLTSVLQAYFKHKQPQGNSVVAALTVITNDCLRKW